jgi:pyruvate,water dikinase
MMTYRTEDMRAFLASGLTLDENERKARRSFYMFYKLDGGKPEFMSGGAAEKAARELLGIAPAGDTQLRGVVASRGKAEGKVRILLPRDFIQIEEDLERFEEGEILVTTMTQPSIVSAMKKAAAIVTDQGGMTSHAAVLAREFGIPCIVGTMTATQMLKDGDVVEVDANRGFVKILKT